MENKSGVPDSSPMSRISTKTPPAILAKREMKDPAALFTGYFSFNFLLSLNMIMKMLTIPAIQPVKSNQGLVSKYVSSQ